MYALMSYQRALTTECFITHLRYKGAHHYVCVYELIDGSVELMSHYTYHKYKVTHRHVCVDALSRRSYH